MSRADNGIGAAIERSWFRRVSLITLLLLPLTALYWLISHARRLGYRLGLFTAYRAPVPVIVVGNISVGGNGKTPMTLYLAELLQQRGKRVGIISRGYGSHPPETPFVVTADTEPHQGGDEPVLLAKRSGCAVVIGGDRKASIEKLLALQSVDVILSDDGLQHYALERDIELCIVDAARRFGNGLLLPAGPLREGQGRLKSVDLVIYNGEQAGQARYQLASSGLYGVADEQPLSPPFAKGVAISAIGNPERFEQSLQAIGVAISEAVHYRDHHHYQASDLTQFGEQAVYMTEKDAVKCRTFAHRQCYYLRVDAKANQVLETQLTTILKRKGVL